MIKRRNLFGCAAALAIALSGAPALADPAAALAAARPQARAGTTPRTTLEARPKPSAVAAPARPTQVGGTVEPVVDGEGGAGGRTTAGAAGQQGQVFASTYDVL